MLFKVLQFCGWVSVACVPKLVNGRMLISPVLSPTRDAYLVFSIIGFFVSIFIYFAFVLNIVNLHRLNNIAWSLVVGRIDSIYL